MKNFKWRKGDFVIAVLVVILFFTSLVYPVYRFFLPSTALIAVIRQENEIVETIDLATVVEPYELTFYHGENQEHYNIIEVAPGKIRVKEANCPEQIDVRVGWLTKAGDIAVCLPHHLIIELKGNQQGDIDIIAR